MPKRRIFISYAHDDAAQVNGFVGCRECLDGVDFYNHKLDHRINSTNSEYVARVIREDYITPASVTVVLIGHRTAESDWVPWEIAESIRQRKGSLGIRLKQSWGRIPAGLPSEAVGSWEPSKFLGWIEWAYQQRQVRVVEPSGRRLVT